MKDNLTELQKHLRIFEDRSEFHGVDSNIEIFNEGVTSEAAKRRNSIVRNAFEEGFLDKLIVNLMDGKLSVELDKISNRATKSVNSLVDSLTSEVGRALIGLSVMQLCIKSIVPEQNIKLHKGSSNRASFSWVEGISMRSLDKNHVTPTLRKFDLLRLNQDGFMMTRSLAENYPYTSLYKANLRGARKEWMSLVEDLEEGASAPLETLKYLLSRLINAALAFNEKAEILLNSANQFLDRSLERTSVNTILRMHTEVSDYAARLLEISIHSLLLSAVDEGVFDGMEVKPLSQMRSANKKHGNIGDVELLEDDQIVESWDAKYGKGYLREEIEEAVEKIQNHDSVKIVGFITNVEIERTNEISKRIEEIKQLYSVNLEVMTFDDWVDRIYDISLNSEITTEEKLSQKWFINYCEYLCQRKREKAPIDEPCTEWVDSLHQILLNTP